MNPRENKAKDEFISGLKLHKRKTRKPVMVGIVGLVGSGKSSVARALAPVIGATIIEADSIRLSLRKRGEGFKSVREIAEGATSDIISKGGNVIFDTDFIDSKKRKKVIAKAGKAGIKFVLLRIYSDLDVSIGRIVKVFSGSKSDEFFAGAATGWKGTPSERGATVKLREMIRRMPQHYSWVNKIGGQWKLKKFPFKVFTEINTTEETEWKKKVKEAGRKILKM